MREIKYKYYLSLNSGREIKTCIFTLKEIEHRIFTHNESIVMAKCQFTGLKDRNGVEVYEGDLLINGSGRISQVIWNTHAGQWDCECKAAPIGSTSSGFVNNRWKRDCKVIGNIHQNPELLK